MKQPKPSPQRGPKRQSREVTPGKLFVMPSPAARVSPEDSDELRAEGIRAIRGLLQCVEEFAAIAADRLKEIEEDFTSETTKGKNNV